MPHRNGSPAPCSECGAVIYPGSASGHFGSKKHQAAMQRRLSRAATPASVPVSPGEYQAELARRRRMAADIAADAAHRFAVLGFGCEIIATWEASSGERTAAHVTTANPDMLALIRRAATREWWGKASR